MEELIMNGFIEIYPGLFYEEATGLPWSTRVPGTGENNGDLKRITSKNSAGYYNVKINGKNKQYHRVIWEHFNGPIPTNMDIDHINNMRDDNRIENLQLLSHKDNSRSRLKNKNNTSGYPGVSWFKPTKKWQAQIQVDGKNKHLGYFDSPETAHQAYLQAKIKYHGIDSIRF